MIAIGTAVFDSVKCAAYRSHLELVAYTAKRHDFWLLDPGWERRTYPFCVRGMVDEMFAREDREGRRADWLLWLEDDIVPPNDLVDRLLAEADPQNRPYVAALAYCRAAPYWPGAADEVDQNGLLCLKQWDIAPRGTVPVDRVGMCAALMHRSVFDRVSEPWFGVSATSTAGIGPDSFWSRRLKDHGIQPHVCCDIEVGHIGVAPIITRELSEKWNKARRASFEETQQ